jgi:DNA repair exonuclease SbcCD ATPase subunit
MIKFKTVRYKNFLSTGNKFSEIVIDDTRTTLLIGPNGSGKSTFMDAISYGLFGKPFRKVKLTQLVNSINRKECLVELKFETGGKDYLIRRGMYPAIFEIHVDGVMKDQMAAVRDSQDFLERYVLKMSEHTFRQIVVLGSGSFVPFMRLPAGERRVIIENLLDIQIFSVMNDLVKGRVSDNQMSLLAAVHQIELLEQSIKLQEEHLKSLQENAEVNVQEKKDELQKCADDIESINKDIADLKETIKDHRPKQDKQSKLREFKTKFSSKKSHIKKQVALVNDNSECPECTQPITQELKENVTATLTQKDEELTKGMNLVSADLERLAIRISEIENVLVKISDKNSSIAGINMSIDRLHRELAEEAGPKSWPSANEITSSKKDLDVQHDIKYNLQEKKHHLNTVQELLKDSGIKTVIIRNYLPLINQLINKFLSALDFYINFELDEGFNETIKSRGRDAFQYGSFSEGEKLRIDLALLFTWREVAKLKSSVATNLLILDEIFDSSLDATGVEDFLGILNTQDDDAHVFVISHKGDQILDKFGRVISAEKEQNFSKIVTN